MPHFIHEAGDRTGFLYNYHPTNIPLGGTMGGDKDTGGGGSGDASGKQAAMNLFFYDHDGDTFETLLKYNPYFFVAATEGHEREVELGMASAFAGQLANVERMDKEDLDMVNHLSGKQRTYLKLIFRNTSDLTAVRAKIDVALQRNKSASNNENPFNVNSKEEELAAAHAFEKTAWMDQLKDIREYDVKYYMRVAIDLDVYVGSWYDVNVTHGETHLDKCPAERYAPAMPRVCAFDIETTKEPLKFPQVETDQIYMISYMLDQRGFLIVNREVVTEDIVDIEYTPKPEYHTHFQVFNVKDEKATIRKFYDEMQKNKPNVYVTYNGDYFDFPFIQARSEKYRMDMRKELGFSIGQDGSTLNPTIPHLDCFYWVNRDSYLPQGSRGLKAVTRAKLGYDPVEVDPEEMLPLAQKYPQKMADYSISDAVATYGLYMKYVHPFIFSLCTIIPMPPDDVLRKGSGTLCESLLMVQAFAKNVIFPNKKVEVKEKFHQGHLIDSETYIGGHVEALKSGIFRSDIPMKFAMNPEAYQNLIDRLDDMLKFALENENGVKMSEVENYDEVRKQVYDQLVSLRDQPVRHETPLIYHLDVGAMYPNIILTNRLQPVAMVTQDVCAGCVFNSPTNENKCQRAQNWIWRADIFTAGRHEYARVKAQLESETFQDSVIAKVEAGATSKQTYGKRSGNVLEGTKYDRKNKFQGKRDGGGGGGGGYRSMDKQQKREEEEALIRPKEDEDKEEGGSDDDGNGGKSFSKLDDSAQTILLKKRLGEYCRKAYRKTTETKEMMRENIICQRENSFYVDTVRLFRDRRYEYKRALKMWKGKVETATDPAELKEAKGRVIQMDSLQLAHKCILNSFYGYVMRKGSRWYSMEMAGIITYVGANLIQMARKFVQQIGVTLELDTDGIWCCLPKSFPEDFTFKTKLDKKKSVSINYPCVVLNKDVHEHYTNDQYQDMVSTGVYNLRDENSIYFEVDGPYLAMLLPAAREEGKGIKKRYAVFNPNGSLAELKGFELKRRGELMLIKDFQALVFGKMLEGTNLHEAFEAAATVANEALDMLFNKGDGRSQAELIAKLVESSNMTRRLSEYPPTQKSMALTTARRIAEFLGPQMVKDKGLSCQYVVTRTPVGKPVTERPIPLNIFKADPNTRAHFLRKWCGDNAITVNTELADILDWEYYLARFSGTVQKIITIPAALQGVKNPVPRIKHPDWLNRMVAARDSTFRQTTLTNFLVKRPIGAGLSDLEDLMAGKKNDKQPSAKSRVKGVADRDIDDQDPDSDVEVESSVSDDDVEIIEQRKAEEERLAREQAAVKELSTKYLGPKSKQGLDDAFFNDAGFGKWLSHAKSTWSHQAQVRKTVEDAPGLVDGKALNAAVGDGKDTPFVDSKVKALRSPWHILEVRDDPSLGPNTVTVFALVGGSLTTLRCMVDRKVLVDFNGDPTAFMAEYPGAITQTSGRVLPRHRNADTLVEVNLSAGNEGASSSQPAFPDGGDRFLHQCRFFRDDVTDVYEGDLTLSQRLFLQTGAVLSVRAEKHLANARLRPLHLRDRYHADELEAAGASSGYLANKHLSTVFLYHALGGATRGLMACVFTATNEVLLVVIQPSEAVKPTLNWKQLAAEAEATLGTAEAHLNFVVRYAPDQQAAYNTLGDALQQAMDGSVRPHLAVVQSGFKQNQLVAAMPTLYKLPVVRVGGTLEDEKIFHTSPLGWIKEVSRRMLQRYFASTAWMEERVNVAKVAGIPLCNLAEDTFVSALDLMFARALKRRSMVLWDARDPAMHQPVDLQPTEVTMTKGYVGWSVECTISQLDVVAVLFSQLIQEGDDPRAHVLSDGGVTVHFHILRDMLSELYGMALTQKKEAAMALLLNFRRWLRNTSSAIYEPQIVTHVNHLVHRALGTLLLRIKKLGGEVIRATPNLVVIDTKKQRYSEAVNFANYLLSAVQDHPMLGHFSLEVAKYWGPQIVVDNHNYIGLVTKGQDGPATLGEGEGEDAVPLPATAAADPDHVELEVESSFNILDEFPAHLQQQIMDRLTAYLSLVREAQAQGLEFVLKDESVTLATRTDRLKSAISQALETRVEQSLQPQLLTDVTSMMHDPNAGKHVTLNYIKTICYLLDLTPALEQAVRRTKNNCLRLLEVEKFAPAAQYTPKNAVTQGYTLRQTICSFCNEEVTLNLKAESSASWQCLTCGNPIDKDAVEAFLVQAVRVSIKRSFQRDLRCEKCRQPSLGCMQTLCHCGGCFIESQSVQGGSCDEELRILRSVAHHHGLEWLKETIEQVLV